MGYMNKKKLKKFRLKGTKVSSKLLYFGSFGLKSLETGRIDSKVLKSFLSVLKRGVKLFGGKYWLGLNNSIEVTKIPIATRMGKGKGNIDRTVAFIRKGQIFCELSISDEDFAYMLLKSAASKLPIKCRVIKY
jgi:large subunit ribosomal protein L16